MTRTAWGYCRLSTQFQVQHTNTFEQHAEAIEAYFRYRLAPQGYTYAGTLEDPAISSRVPLIERPAGKQINECAKSGDAVIFPRLDRGFRNVVDLLTTYDLWHKRGVSVHLLDLNIDTTTPVGRFAMTVFGAAIELDRTMIRERMEAGRAHAEAQGWYTLGRPPYGFKIKKVNDNGRVRQKLIPNEEQRWIASTVLELRNQGLTFQQVREQLRRMGCAPSKVPPHATLQQWMEKEQELRARESLSSATLLPTNGEIPASGFSATDAGAPEESASLS